MKSFKIFSYFILAFAAFGQTQAMEDSSEKAWGKKYEISRWKYKGYVLHTCINIQNTDAQNTLTIRAESGDFRAKFRNIFSDFSFHNFKNRIANLFSNKTGAILQANYTRYATKGPKKRVGFIVELKINRRHRRQGLGKKLIVKATQKLNEKGCQIIVARVKSENNYLSEKTLINSNFKSYSLSKGLKNKLKSDNKDNTGNTSFKLMRYYTP